MVRYGNAGDGLNAMKKLTVRLLAGCMAGVIVMLCACLSSSVRYTSGIGENNSGKREYKVPPGWDYRSTYSVPCERMKQVAASYIGIPYRFGGMSRRGVDCSGLVCLIYREVSRAKLPHSSGALRRLGKKVGDHKAQCGDLVFFKRGIFGRVNHVGIFLNESTFIHASTKKGVIYSNLDDDYYRKHFVEMRRIF